MIGNGDYPHALGNKPVNDLLVRDAHVFVFKGRWGVKVQIPAMPQRTARIVLK